MMLAFHRPAHIFFRGFGFPQTAAAPRSLPRELLLLVPSAAAAAAAARLVMVVVEPEETKNTHEDTNNFVPRKGKCLFFFGSRLLQEFLPFIRAFQDTTMTTYIRTLIIVA